MSPSISQPLMSPSGWFIEKQGDGSLRVVEVNNAQEWVKEHSSGNAYTTDTCLEYARSEEFDNGNQVYWTREAADDALLQMTNPAEFWHKELKAKRIHVDDFVQLVGPLEAERRLHSG